MSLWFGNYAVLGTKPKRGRQWFRQAGVLVFLFLFGVVSGGFLGKLKALPGQSVALAHKAQLVIQKETADDSRHHEGSVEDQRQNCETKVPIGLGLVVFGYAVGVGGWVISFLRRRYVIGVCFLLFGSVFVLLTVHFLILPLESFSWLPLAPACGR